MSKAKDFRVVMVEMAGHEIFSLEERNMAGIGWREFTVLGTSPKFNSADEAEDYIKSLEKGAKTVVKEFQFVRK